jgi:hypothetical protein
MLFDRMSASRQKPPVAETMAGLGSRVRPIRSTEREAGAPQHRSLTRERRAFSHANPDRRFATSVRASPWRRGFRKRVARRQFACTINSRAALRARGIVQAQAPGTRQQHEMRLSALAERVAWRCKLQLETSRIQRQAARDRGGRRSPLLP